METDAKKHRGWWERSAESENASQGKEDGQVWCQPSREPRGPTRVCREPVRQQPAHLSGWIRLRWTQRITIVMLVVMVTDEPPPQHHVCTCACIIYSCNEVPHAVWPFVTDKAANEIDLREKSLIWFKVSEVQVHGLTVYLVELGL